MRYLLLILLMCAIPAQAGIIIGTGVVPSGTEATIYGDAQDKEVYYASPADEAWSTTRSQGAGTMGAFNAASMAIGAEVNDAEEYWENAIFRGFLYFTLPAGSEVLSATLYLVNLTHNGNHDLVVQEGTQAKPAVSGDFDSFPSAPNGTSFGNTGSITGTGTVAITLNAAALTYLTGKLGTEAKLVVREYTHDFGNVDPSDGARHSALYGSQDNTTQGNRPRLVITYTE